MSKLFLINEAIDTTDIDLFKKGMFDLIGIEKNVEHTFFKNDSIYNLSILYDNIYSNMHGQEEQEIYRFIEQLSPYQGVYINDEEKAYSYCQSVFYGFLGFDFSRISIDVSKQINGNLKYREWCFKYSPNKEYLLRKTPILPENKESHITDHHGKKELTDFWKKIKHCPYIISGKTTNFGGDDFIRKINDDGTIDLVLVKTERRYAILIKTTAVDQLETNAIAEIIRQEYNP